MCNYSFDNRKKSPYRSFIDGMGSLNLWGGKFHYDRYSSPEQADCDAIKSDWNIVGVDMKNSIKHLTNINHLKFNGSR